MRNFQENSKPPQLVSLLHLMPDDWPVWRSLRLQALKEAPQAFCSTLKEWQGPGDTEERWRNRLISVPLNLVAQLHDEFIGMVGATDKKEDGTVELISLWVKPSGRGQGVGDILVDAVVAWAREQNATYVALDVRESNQRAKALYLRHGFVDVGASSPAESKISVLERRFLHSCVSADQR